MNETLKNTAKELLKDLLRSCTEPQQLIFKRMYSHKNLDADIDTVVDNMDDSKLDWALSQVERTVISNSNKNS